MHFIRRVFLGTFLLGLTLSFLGLGAFFIYDARQENSEGGASGFGPASRERVFSVAVTTAKTGSHVPWVEAFGEVRAKERLMLRAASGGRIIATHPNFIEGGRVRKGELIVKIDPTDAQAALLQAQADAADAALEKVQAEASLVLAEQELAAAQEQLRLREAAVARQKNLTERGIGSTSTLEVAELALSSARQGLLAKEQALQSAKARIEQSQTRADRATLNVEIAQRSLDETQIMAPFDGVLSGINMRNDGRVGMNEALAEVIATDALEVAARLSTSQYTRLLNAGGQLTPLSAEVILEAGTDKFVAQGTVSRESPQVGADQTGRLLFVDIAQNNAALKVGDFVTLRIYEPVLDHAVRVPAVALGRDARVLVVGAEDRLEDLPVTILRRIGNDVLVDGAGFEGREYVETRTPALGAGIKIAPLRRDANGQLIVPEPAPSQRGGGWGGRGKGEGGQGGAKSKNGGKPAPQGEAATPQKEAK